MCGIAGFNWEDKELIHRMTSILEHRGPDGEGYYLDQNVSLGHRRLSIIDLSSAGKMPMSNEDETIWITYNGEIYNFKELRLILEEKGHRFKSNTDTEAIIHGYEEWGEDCVQRFNGMFAFAIWDGKKKKFFLSRDRLGAKPLYYYFSGGKFIFASEIKSILQFPLKKEIDYTALNHYLAYFPVPAPLTIFKDIKKLLPGHNLILQQGKLLIKEYWDVKFTTQYTNEKEICGKTLALLQKSIEKRMISDVPLGAFLSGGIDSSTVVAIMSKLSSQPVKTFSIGFNEEEFDELKYARLVAEKFGTDHHEKIVEPQLIKVLPEIIWQLDEPYADHSALPVYFVSQLARKKVTVTLSGDGGDELFGGYHRYIRQQAAQKMASWPKLLLNTMQKSSKLIPGKKGDKASRWFNYVKMDNAQRYAGWFTIFEPEMKKELYTSATFNKIPSLDSSSVYTKYFDACNSQNIINKMSYTDLKVYIPNDIFVKLDRMSMLHSLEAREPLLDYHLVEFASSIDPKLKTKNLVKKYLLKKTVEPLLPKQIICRQKKGFGLPLEHWFQKELKSLAYDVLLSDIATKRGYFNKEYIKTILDKHQQGKRNYGAHLWSLLCFELWNRVYMDQDKVPERNKLKLW